MCGGFHDKRRVIDDDESSYLLSLYRGLYVNKDLQKGHIITLDDVYAAIPYLKKEQQITSREFSNNFYILNKNLRKNSPLTSKDIQ